MCLTTQCELLIKLVVDFKSYLKTVDYGIFKIKKPISLLKNICPTQRVYTTNKYRLNRTKHDALRLVASRLFVCPQ